MTSTDFYSAQLRYFGVVVRPCAVFPQSTDEISRPLDELDMGECFISFILCVQNFDRMPEPGGPHIYKR